MVLDAVFPDVVPGAWIERAQAALAGVSLNGSLTTSQVEPFTVPGSGANRTRTIAGMAIAHVCYPVMPYWAPVKSAPNECIISAVLVDCANEWAYDSVNAPGKQSRSSSEVAIKKLVRCRYLPGADQCQVRGMKLNYGHCIDLCGRARAGVTCRNIEIASICIDGWRAPDRTAQAAIRHRLENLLNRTRRGAHLDKFALNGRTIAKRSHADINAPVIDSWRGPDEVPRGRAQGIFPNDMTVGSVQGIKTGIASADKIHQHHLSMDFHGSDCSRAGHAYRLWITIPVMVGGL